MSKLKTKVVTAHVPQDLADKVDAFASRLERSRGWILKQALADWVAREEERERMTLAALDDVDQGAHTEHGKVREWAESLGSKSPLPAPLSQK